MKGLIILSEDDFNVFEYFIDPIELELVLVDDINDI